MVLKIAHRGDSLKRPENSMEAFSSAAEKNIDAVEFDVHQTKDKEIIVMHDHDYDGEFCKGDVPRLEDVLDLLKGKCMLKIDIKDYGMEENLLNRLKEFEIDNFMITSQKFPIIKKIKELNPKIKVEAGGFKTKLPVDEMVKIAKSYNADILSPHCTITTQKLVDGIHERGLEVHVWTANDKEVLERMISYGVDGVESDCPDLF